MCICNWWIKACIFFKSCPTPVQMCSDLPLLVRPGYCLSVSLIDRPDILCPRPHCPILTSDWSSSLFPSSVSCGYRVTPSFVLWSFSSCGLWLLQTELLQLLFPPWFFLSIMFFFLFLILSCFCSVFSFLFFSFLLSLFLYLFPSQFPPSSLYSFFSFFLLWFLFLLTSFHSFLLSSFLPPLCHLIGPVLCQFFLFFPELTVIIYFYEFIFISISFSSDMFSFSWIHPSLLLSIFSSLKFLPVSMLYWPECDQHRAEFGWIERQLTVLSIQIQWFCKIRSGLKGRTSFILLSIHVTVCSDQSIRFCFVIFISLTQGRLWVLETPRRNIHALRRLDRGESVIHRVYQVSWD